MRWPLLLCVASDEAAREGAPALDALAAELRLALPVVEVAWIATDAAGERIGDALARLPRPDEGLAAIVAPLVLAEEDDVALASVRLSTARPDVVATAAWGNDPGVVTALLDRLAESGVAPGSTVVLAVPAAADGEAPPFAARVAEALRGAWDGPVRVAAVGDGVGGLEKVAAAVHAARAYGEEGAVAVAALMLLPGEDHGLLAGAAADAVTAPLAPHPALVAAIAERYSALVRGPSPAAPHAAP